LLHGAASLVHVDIQHSANVKYLPIIHGIPIRYYVIRPISVLSYNVWTASLIDERTNAHEEQSEIDKEYFVAPDGFYPVLRRQIAIQYAQFQKLMGLVVKKNPKSHKWEKRRKPDRMRISEGPQL
jgi:hypothetical protein